MTNEQKLKEAFEDVIWMAIRYAHGRHTYAPGMVRDAVAKVQEVYPDWKPKNDITIKFEPDESGVGLRGDWLDDLMPNSMMSGPEDNANRSSGSRDNRNG